MQQPAAEQKPNEVRQPAFPRTVTIAGITWLVYGGCLILLVGWVSFAAYPQAGLFAFFGWGLLGMSFIPIGVRSLRGTSRDTLDDGIGSIIFGLCHVPVGWWILTNDRDAWLAVSLFLLGAGLVVAGVLALAGRRTYEAWLQTQDVKQGGLGR
jgi:hypothetical protein